MSDVERLIPGWQNDDAWSTQRLPSHRQFDAWRNFVIEAHMHWDIPSVSCEHFPAFIRQGKFDGFRTAHLTSTRGGVVGTRGEHELSQDAEALFSFIYVAQGSIRLDIGKRQTDLLAGDCTLWDTTRPMRFTTGANLRQITFSMPHSRLRRVLNRVDDYVGHKIDGTTPGACRLFIEHMISVDHQFGDLSKNHADRFLNATLELLAAALESSAACPDLDRDGSRLQAVCQHIRQRLDDWDLSVSSVATEFGISERQLYRLFGRMQTTPSAWIRKQRLEECQRELRTRSSSGRSITDIALRWGFRDPGTFSKIFRKAYGVRPTEIKSRIL